MTSFFGMLENDSYSKDQVGSVQSFLQQKTSLYLK